MRQQSAGRLNGFNNSGKPSNGADLPSRFGHHHRCPERQAGPSGIIQQLLEQGSELACCSINVTEVYAGLKPGEEIKTARFLKSLRFFEVTWDMAKLAGDLLNQWRSRPDAVTAGCHRCRRSAQS